MNCPYCQSPVDESTGLCTGCGARIIKQPSGTRSAEPARQNVRSAAPDMAKTVSNTGVLLGKAAREARMKNAVESGELISDDRLEAKKAMLEKYPSLQAMYKPEDSNTQVLYFRNARAVFSSFTAAPETVAF